LVRKRQNSFSDSIIFLIHNPPPPILSFKGWGDLQRGEGIITSVTVMTSMTVITSITNEKPNERDKTDCK